jgi:hypothetical protein
VAARQGKVNGYRDQSMAKLFVKSGWSQEQLADHLGKRLAKEVTRRWVGYHLCFGRFLAFFGTKCSEDESPATYFTLPPSLTEWKFRKFWQQTEAVGEVVSWPGPAAPA